MIPVLYEPTEYTFQSNGLGLLYDAISCRVTEEHNGMYELEMEYPLDGALYDQLVIFNILLAKPNDTDRPQPFDIYQVEENGSTAKVMARHISYRLAYMPCISFAQCNNVSTALTKIKNSMAFGASKYSTNYAFSFTSDGDDVTEAFYVETSYTAKQLLNMVCEKYKKDLYYDRFTISLIHRGEDNGVTIRHGLNIRSVEKQRNTDGAYNAVCDYYYQKDKGLKLGTSSTVNTAQLPYPRALIEDVSGDYNNETVPTIADMDTRATAMLVTQSTVGSLSVDVDMVALWESEEHEQFKPLMHVSLCDVVRVHYPEIDLSVNVTVEKLVYDVLSERTESITLSSKGQDLSTTIAESNARIEEAQKNYLVNIYGGKACSSGTVRLTYSSSTRMTAIVETGLSYIDNIVVTVADDANTPWSQVTVVSARRNSPRAGAAAITVAGNGFVNAHILNVCWQAVGTK